ncbi:protein phosphatase regulator [Rhizina undulata]
MTEVLSASLHNLDGGYYQSSPSPRCLSPQPPPYGKSTAAYSSSIPRSHSFEIRKEVTPPSSASSSPQFSSVVYSAQSSFPSSVASSICLDTRSKYEPEDNLFFPVYDYATSSPPQEFDSPSPPGASDYPTPTNGSPTIISRVDSPELPDPLFGPIDDSGVRHEPSRHVDYLSHDWKEEDIWSSWRYMVGKRKVYSNAARLENASWRTWAKSKYKLKTVSPETLNWLKDCDVTWLYGPLSTGKEKVSLLGSQSSVSPMESARLPTSTSFYTKKPILKKRSMSEIMLQRSLSNSSLLKQAAAAIESQQSEKQRQLARPALIGRAHSEFSSFPYSSQNTSAINTSELPSALSTGYQSPSYTRHIHFNDRVEQCIAVDKEEEEEEEEENLFEEDLEDSSSDDDGLVMMSRSKNSSRSSTRGSFSEHQTIAMLPSTTLKYVEEAVDVKKTDSFSSFTSFFSTVSTGSTSSTSSIGSTETVKPAVVGTKSYFLEDDDEDLQELDWEPRGAFANRRDSIAVTRPRFETGNASPATEEDDDDFQLPKYSYEEDEDEEVAAGLFGRAVDAVNTARDIAHVLWNVGWRR